MKTNDLSKTEIHNGGGCKETLIMISFVSLLVGFILGATVAILKTQPSVAPTPAPMVGPTVKESEKDIAADYEKEIRYPEVERK